MHAILDPWGHIQHYCKDIELTSEAMMGRNSVVVAKLLAHCVNPAMSRQQMIETTGGGRA